MNKKILDIKNLRSKVDETEILKGLDLEMNKGEIHIMMGPNGAGKSTFANVLMGHPKHEIIDGEIIFNDKIINDLSVDKRAKEGMFLSFQYPEEIPGVTVENFLRNAKMTLTGENQGVFAFRKVLKEKMKLLEMDESYASRYLNQGFSGGEKKKNEILQMVVLEPKLAILDETDSGLDIDAIRIVSNGVKAFSNDDNAILVITHYNKILDYLEPDFVHILVDGKIVKTGGIKLAREIEEKGFEEFK
ncbi:Fe-S cluster assembly ATPase SufC [Clostridium sp. D2Q-14]|uniref:Fe-S cluster assembly ATPase SufC n=1 Tax=Anaeromonas gelatinilytica TaxID=2683194 RepID=UPI00193B37C6|nr:Fe-S cluster assembly ATPase SufC [Anaeromonas gelatinilytica]MBS4534853.1 Fe-S cluster assembly ATPase SufC [Anaeromonas gelatinilytica]